AARDKTVHANVRQPILVAAFTRALLLDRDDVAEELLPAMRAVYPTLAPRLERWRTASGPSRRFAAIDLIVHAPALRAYIPPLTIPRTDPEEVWHTRNRDTNWWCRDGLQYWEARYPDSFKPQPIAPPLFLDSNEAERAALRALGSGSTWMLRSTMNWARTAPKDRRVPEALAMAVQGTRWGCADDETAKLSQAAFNLLHAQYPNSQWARETKYWYTGRD
ncbi:MAG TPA: hypothetical protein VJZ00_23850, partial [Thermoanaerobaculia bacterium]|nr:hypothetical protein [Thermoanaerobaculia bacterium]